MSRSSRQSLREKSIARRVLERAASEEIDEFIFSQSRKEMPRESYEHDPTDWDDLDDVFGCIPDEDDWYDAYEDEEDWDDFDDYDYSRDDDYWDIGGPDTYSGEIGTYYKDRENKTYLCCRVHGVIAYVNIHTGHECSVNQFCLEKVG